MGAAMSLLLRGHGLLTVCDGSGGRLPGLGDVVLDLERAEVVGGRLVEHVVHLRVDLLLGVRRDGVPPLQLLVEHAVFGHVSSPGWVCGCGGQNEQVHEVNPDQRSELPSSSAMGSSVSKAIGVEVTPATVRIWSSNAWLVTSSRTAALFSPTPTARVISRQPEGEIVPFSRPFPPKRRETIRIT